MGDECLAIAFHPSGFNILVALPDKINICTILSREIKVKTSLPIKGCHEMQFSHGGHLFACAAGAMTKEIHVYNFYTNECPKNMQFSGHTNRVKSIAWFENDMGFASTSTDGNIYFYDLFKKETKRNDEYDFQAPSKDTRFSCISIIPGSDSPYNVFGVGTDAAIHHSQIKEKRCKIPPEHPLTQIVVHKNGRAIIAGVGDPHGNVPGSI